MPALFLRLALGAACVAAAPAFAQLKVEVAGVGANQIPVAVAAFPGEPAGLTDIVKADLARSGVFRIVDGQADAADYGAWKARGADAVAVGTAQKLANGSYEVRYKLVDTVQGKELSTLGQSVPPGSARLAAHRIADDVFEKLTGVRGIFATRIAYVVAGKEYRIEVADADGGDAKLAVPSREPFISPSWSPDGAKVAYVSWERQKPEVYVQDLVTGRRTVVAGEKGNNSAPAWSPDGKRLAVALSRAGGTQLFIVNADGSGLRRLTESGKDVIDTEPHFSADGRTLYFMSDRGGSPQIYRMPVEGGAAQRVTFQGPHNISPRLSPDGATLAYIGLREGRYRLYVLDLATGQETRLTDGTDDQSPSFSANGKYLLYADRSGRGTLGVVSTDSRTRFRISMPGGDIREPAWGPFM